jgi:transposase
LSSWWKEGSWSDLEKQLPDHLLGLLSSLRVLIQSTEKQLQSRTREIEQQAPAPLPVGVGKLTAQVLEREIADWDRFKNRRQVASYTGLCPSEDSSGAASLPGPREQTGQSPTPPGAH